MRDKRRDVRRAEAVGRFVKHIVQHMKGCSARHSAMPALSNAALCEAMLWNPSVPSTEAPPLPRLATVLGRSTKPG